MLHFVYELIDPRTETAVYVGITADPNGRFQQHMSCTDENNEKNEWIQQLLEDSIEPRMKILEIVQTREEAQEKEKQIIQVYLSKGLRLLNVDYNIQKTKVSRNRETRNRQEAYRVPVREHLTTTEAAERANLSRVHINRLLRTQQLEYYQLGNVRLIYTDSLEKYLAQPYKKPGRKGPIKKKKQDATEEPSSLSNNG